MDAADAAGIESPKMMKKWNVTYDKYKKKLHYGCLKHYYSKFSRPHPPSTSALCPACIVPVLMLESSENDKTTPIHCGFRILHSSEHMNQDVILPSEFAIYMVSVHKKITGDREQRKQQLRDAVESCVGKPDKYGIYNACLLDLSGPDVKGMRWTEELPKDACIGPLVLGDDFFSFKVFSSFSPMGTKVNTESRLPWQCHSHVLRLHGRGYRFPSDRLVDSTPRCCTRGCAQRRIGFGGFGITSPIAHVTRSGLKCLPL